MAEASLLREDLKDLLWFLAVAGERNFTKDTLRNN
jgi:hypothetical protein